MRCQVCHAPAVGSRCVFCRVELNPPAEAPLQDVLDHLAETVPGATSHRGAFDRGPIRAVELPGGFSARFKKEELVLEPGGPLRDWLEQALGDLRVRAQSDHELRSALTRQGWSLT